MCFILSEDSKPKIAEEDIICYKIVETVVLSPDIEEVASLFTGYVYTLGELNPKVIIKVANSFSIDKGYHSYIKRLEKSWYSSSFSHHRELVECTIPKGTLYYANDHEYVSENIIINKIL